MMCGKTVNRNLLQVERSKKNMFTENARKYANKSNRNATK